MQSEQSAVHSSVNESSIFLSISVTEQLPCVAVPMLPTMQMRLLLADDCDYMSFACYSILFVCFGGLSLAYVYFTLTEKSMLSAINV